MTDARNQRMRQDSDADKGNEVSMNPMNPMKSMRTSRMAGHEG